MYVMALVSYKKIKPYCSLYIIAFPILNMGCILKHTHGENTFSNINYCITIITSPGFCSLESGSGSMMYSFLYYAE